MIEQYSVEDSLLKDQTYGVDNALANVMAAIERLSTDDATESAVLRTKLTQLQERLERLRSEALQHLYF
jgi:TolA-binding protein